MKIPTLSVFAIFALLGMTLAMGSYGYGSYGGYGASYVPVSVGAGHGAGGFGQGGFCKSRFSNVKQCVLEFTGFTNFSLVFFIFGV